MGILRTLFRYLYRGLLFRTAVEELQKTMFEISELAINA